MVVWSGQLQKVLLAMAKLGFRGGCIYATHVSWFLSTERWPKRINHKNKCHNRACVDIDHIYEGTARQNMLDRKIDGTHWSPFEQPGFRPHNAVLDSEKRRKIKKMYATGQITQKILGEIFSVSRGTIADVVRGRYGW